MRNRAHSSIWTQDTDNALTHTHYGIGQRDSINALSIHGTTHVTRKTKTYKCGMKVTSILVHTTTGIIEIDCFLTDTGNTGD